MNTDILYELFPRGLHGVTAKKKIQWNIKVSFSYQIDI